MKRALLVVVCLFVMAGVSNANFINVLSQEYHIYGRGYIAGYEDIYPETMECFDITSNSTASKIIYAEGAGFYYVNSTAYGYIDNDSAELGIRVRTDDNAGQTHAYASSLITFSPLGSYLKISHEAISDEGAMAYLLDTNTGEYLTESWSIWPSIHFSAVLPVDPSHTYEMFVKVDDVLWCPWGVGAFIRIESIPEPSILLLLGIGLSGLAWLRKNK